MNRFHRQRPGAGLTLLLAIGILTGALSVAGPVSAPAAAALDLQVDTPADYSAVETTSASLRIYGRTTAAGSVSVSLNGSVAQTVYLQPPGQSNQTFDTTLQDLGLTLDYGPNAIVITAFEAGTSPQASLSRTLHVYRQWSLQVVNLNTPPTNNLIASNPYQLSISAGYPGAEIEVWTSSGGWQKLAGGDEDPATPGLQLTYELRLDQRGETTLQVRATDTSNAYTNQVAYNLDYPGAVAGDLPKTGSGALILAGRNLSGNSFGKLYSLDPVLTDQLTGESKTVAFNGSINLTPGRKLIAVDPVLVKIDGGSEEAATVNGANFSWPGLDWTSLAEGPHTVRVIVKDVNNNDSSPAVFTSQGYDFELQKQPGADLSQEPPATTASSTLTLSGAWRNTTNATIALSGATFADGGSIKTFTPSAVDSTTVQAGFSAQINQNINLISGDNFITLSATNVVDGNILTTTRTHKVTYYGPSVIVASPAAGITLRSAQLTIEGSITGYSPSTMSLQAFHNGQAIAPAKIAVNSGGGFTVSATLSPGANTFVLKAVNTGSGVQLTQTGFNVTYDASAVEYPVIVVTSPADGTSVSASSVSVMGTVTSAEQLTIRVNGGAWQSVNMGSSGAFSKTVQLPGTGLYQITLRASRNGQSTDKVITVSRSGPVIGGSILIATPADNSTVYAEKIWVRGEIPRGAVGQVKLRVEVKNDASHVGGSPYTVSSISSSGNFALQVQLAEGENTITVADDQDPHLLTTTEPLRVIYQIPDIVVTYPFPGETVITNRLLVSGKVSAGIVTGSLRVGGQAVPVDQNGSFTTYVALKAGSNTIKISAQKEETGSTSQEVTVNYDDRPVVGAESSAGISSRGGKLDFFSGRLGVQLPAQAFPQGTSIQLARKDETDYLPGLPPQRALAGEIWELTTDANQAALKPFTITLMVSDEIRSAQLSKVAVYRYLPATGSWQAAGGSVDTKKGTVSITTPDFGIYAALVSFLSFDDIWNDWAREGIETLLAKGIVSGYPDGKFRPGNSITRAEFTKMLVQSLNLPTNSAGPASFSDVARNNWAFDPVETAVRAGIVRGYSAGVFVPDEIITREQAATLLARAANLADMDLNRARKLLADKFPDLNQPPLPGETGATSWSPSGADYVSPYSLVPVAQSINAGLIEGVAVEGGKVALQAQSPVTRAQAATLIVRLLGLAGGL